MRLARASGPQAVPRHGPGRGCTAASPQPATAEEEMGTNTLYWEDVEDGQDLPPFTYELSLLRLVSFVRASGLYDYVHFDGAYAKAAGARDAFISTPHVAGLFGRLLTDWSGPTGEIRSLTFAMRTQSCTND